MGSGTAAGAFGGGFVSPGGAARPQWACSANLVGLFGRNGRCDSVAGIRADVFATHDGSQERQDAQLLASGALGAARPQGGAGDGGAAWRARCSGSGAGSQLGAAD